MPRSPAQLALRRFLHRPVAVAGLVVIVLFIAVAILRAADRAVRSDRDLAGPRSARRRRWRTGWAPTRTAATCSRRVIFGARASLLAGVVSVLIAAGIGVPAGLLAGFARGLDRRRAQPHRRCHAGLSVPDPGDRAGRVPRPRPDQRDDRDRRLHRAALHARGARGDAGRQQQRLRRGGARHRQSRLARRGPPRAAEHRAADHWCRARWRSPRPSSPRRACRSSVWASSRRRRPGARC